VPEHGSAELDVPAGRNHLLKDLAAVFQRHPAQIMAGEIEGRTIPGRILAMAGERLLWLAVRGSRRGLIDHYGFTFEDDVFRRRSPRPLQAIAETLVRIVTPDMKLSSS